MILFYVIFTILSLLGGLFILWDVPFLSTLEEKVRQDKKLSIIIPARNEEKNLPILLKSLQKQSYQPYEILVVDDDSQDQTAEVAVSYGAKVVQFPKDKRDWVGKAAGCYYGAQAAKGEWFLFLDADIFLPREDSLEKLIDGYNKKAGPGILSIQPYHVIEELYENLSLIFNLLVLAGMNRFSFLQEKLEPAGAFGPSMLIDRETYFEKGGHKRARGSIMENIDLGRIFLKEGVPVELYGGKDSLHFRMYSEGYKELAEGWSKSFVSGSKSTHPLILIGTSLWIAGAFVTAFFIPYAWFIGEISLLILGMVGYILFYLQLLRMTRYAGNFHRGVLFLYPILFFYFLYLFAWSAIKTKVFKQVSWKGRTISMEEHADGK